ncbi:hypothetical protein D3C73_1131250 [compost metagenome]
MPEIMLLYDVLSLRLNASVALLVTLPVPNDPNAPPLPTCSTPALIVVPPVQVFAPLSIKLPVFIFVRRPAPETTPFSVSVVLSVTSTVPAPLRSTVRPELNVPVVVSRPPLNRSPPDVAPKLRSLATIARLPVQNAVPPL